MALVEQITELWQTVGRFLRIRRSGVFSADLYSQSNPDVGAGKERSLLHFSKHGFREQREWNQTALGRWLLPYLLDGSVDEKAVNQLRKDFEENRVQTSEALEKFCIGQGLNPNSYKFHSAYEWQDFDKAFNILADLPMQEAFLHHYVFARRHMKMGKLHDAYRWVLAQLLNQRELTFRQLVAARDIADAIGHPDQPRHEFNKLLLSAFSRMNLPRGTSRLRALWQVGFPLIIDNSEICLDILDLLPDKLKQDVSAEGHQVVSGVESWSSLINLSTLNSLQATQYSLPSADHPSDRKERVDPQRKILRVRLMNESFWYQEDISDTLKTYLSAFKTAVLHAQKQFDAILPIPSTQIYDRRLEDRTHFPTLSYHTISDLNQRYLNFKESPLPGYFHFDRTGFSGWSSQLKPSLADKSKIEATFQSLQSDIIDAKRTKYEQSTRSENLPEDFVFIALQVPGDAVMTLAHMSRNDMVETVIEACADTACKVLIKPHPLDKSRATARYLKQVTDGNRNAQLTNAPIHDLLKAAKVVVTVNSGVGMEALLHQKPVITVGASDYRDGAIEVKTGSELHCKLKESLKNSNSNDLIKQAEKVLVRYTQDSCFTFDNIPILFDSHLHSVSRPQLPFD